MSELQVRTNPEDVIEQLRARCLAAEAEVKQQGITIGYFQQKLDAAEAERDAYISNVAMLVSDRNGWVVRILELEQERDAKAKRVEVLETVTRAYAQEVLMLIKDRDRAHQERDQYKRESDALRWLDANVTRVKSIKVVQDISLKRLLWFVYDFEVNMMGFGEHPLEAIENAMKAQQTMSEERGF